ncbi:Putative cell wall binding repeat 2 [Agrococcus baldri]|uniref:Cell wall binding repeat 2 n=1 Tax=Agrococcus baldri TaxID=153730 RepID=A0AA94KYL3_9MICO|nr:cell wall-binding repeat-containing protein [Agrococcus baldri]SFR99826.1 Putative cell wall binding repeat 2 [Agrococcus baldri]
MAEAARTTVGSRWTRLQALAVAAALAVGLAVLPATAPPAQAAPPPGQGEVIVTITADDTGLPVENAWVQVTADDPNGLLFDGYTDASGTVTIHADPGAYRIWASYGGYAESFFPNAFLLADAQVIRVVEGATQSRAMRLMVGGSATITTTFAGAAPEQEVMVSLVRRQADGSFEFVPNIGCSTFTGSCLIEGVPPGDYRAIASIGSWTPGYGQWLPGVWPSRTGTVSIADRQHVDATVTMPAATTVTGSVMLDFASAVPAVDVQVRAVYLDAMPQEEPLVAQLSIAPGANAPFTLPVEPGRAFQLQLESQLTNTGATFDPGKVIITEQWTASGMALVGTAVTVAVGEARSFTLTGHAGARFTGDYTIRGDSGGPLSVDCDTCGIPVVELYRQVGGAWVLVDEHRWGSEDVFGAVQGFWFTGVAPGTYTLGFWADTLCREYWRDSETLTGATSFQVTMAGITGELRADLQPIAGGCTQPTPDPDPGPDPDPDPGPGPGPDPDPGPDPGPGPDPDPGSLPTAERLAGANRYATSVAISQRSFPGTAPVVYLASGTSFPDGLAAGPAAAHEGGPVLLTPQGSVPQVVLDEIARLQPAKVVIVGGTPSVSAAASQQVAGLPGSPTVTRLGGANRYETSRLIAAHAFPTGAPAAFLATGAKFPDALTAGPAAALRDGPVLLVRGNAPTADAETLQTLAALGVGWVGIAGDANSVSAGIASSVDAAVPTVQRFAGGNRFETATLIGGLFPTADTVLVASGLGFADALPGAAAAGAAGAPMVLARNSCMPAPTLAALEGWMPSRVVLLGGIPTLNAAVAGYTRC